MNPNTVHLCSQSLLFENKYNEEDNKGRSDQGSMEDRYGYKEYLATWDNFCSLVLLFELDPTCLWRQFDTSGSQPVSKFILFSF